MSINREGKTVIVVFAIVASILFGVSYMVNEEPDQNWLIIAIGLLLLALFFWLWIRRDDNVTSEAEANAIEATEKAEAVAAEAKAKVENVTESKAAEAAKAEQDAKEKAEQEALAKAKAAQDAKEKAAQEAIAKAKAEQDAKEKAEQEALAKAKAEQDAKEKAEAEAKAAQAKAAEEAAAKLSAAGAATSKKAEDKPKAAAASEPDDLTRVEGVGPKYSDALVAAGIDTFAKLAKTSLDDIKAAAKAAGMRNTKSMETWAEQAGLAAKGDWDGLEKLQDALTGGRRD